MSKENDFQKETLSCQLEIRKEGNVGIETKDLQVEGTMSSLGFYAFLCKFFSEAGPEFVAAAEAALNRHKLVELKDDEEE